LNARSKVIFSLVLFTLILVPLVAIASEVYLGNVPKAVAQTNGWLQPINLSNDGNNASYPWIANVGSRVYVAWTEEDHGILFRMSPDNGSTWYPSLNYPALDLSTSGGVASYPIVYAVGGDVYVVWSQSVNNELQIFFAGSTNNGSSFAAPIQLTSGNSENGWITPVIAASGPYVYVAYTGTGKNSFVVSSDNYGVTWNPAFYYAPDHEPQVAAVGANGYAVSDGVVLAVTHDGGVNWSISINGSDQGDEPWIAASGSYVYIVSQTKTANGAIHFIACGNYGTSCNPNTLPGNLISEYPVINDSWEPQMIAAGNDVYVTFHTLTAPILNYYTYSTNNGESWSTPVSLSDPNHLTGWAPQLAMTGCGGGYSCSNSSPYIFTAWPELDGLTSNMWSMFASESTNSGASWTPSPGINVSAGGFGSSGPNDIATSSLAAFGNHAFLVWQDNQTGFGQVIFSESNPNFTASGSTFVTTFTTSSVHSPNQTVTNAAGISTTGTPSLPPPANATGIVPIPTTISASQAGTILLAAAIVAVALTASAVIIIRRKNT
jgi:hypothetical protein